MIIMNQISYLNNWLYRYRYKPKSDNACIAVIRMSVNYKIEKNSEEEGFGERSAR